MAANNQYVPPSKRPGGSWREDPRATGGWASGPLGSQLSDVKDFGAAVLGNQYLQGAANTITNPIGTAAETFGPTISKMGGKVWGDFNKAEDRKAGKYVGDGSDRGRFPEGLDSASLIRGLPLNGPTQPYPSRVGIMEPVQTPAQTTEDDGLPSSPYAEEANDEVVTPDPAKDPAGAIAASTKNKGLSNPSDGTKREKPEDKPVEPTPQEAAQAAVEEAGKSISEMNLNKPVWYESQSFNSALLSFGLNMLSGNSLAESFNAAGQMFDEQFAKETREGWRDQLLEAGYDPIEIQAYIDTGDNKALTDPKEKAAREMDYRMKAINLQAAERENDPARIAQLERERQEDREWGRTKDQSNMDYQAGILRNQQAQAAETRRHNIATENAAQQKLIAAEGGMTTTEQRSFSTAVKDANKAAIQRLPFSNTAAKDLTDIKRYINDGNMPALAGALQTFKANQGRALKGGNAMMTQKDLDATTAMIDWISQGKNIASMKLGGKPIPEWIAMQEASVADDRKNLSATLRESASENYKALLAAGKTPAAAKKAVNIAFAPSGVGGLDFDEDGNYIPSKAYHKAGAKTVQIQR